MGLPRERLNEPGMSASQGSAWVMNVTIPSDTSVGSELFQSLHEAMQQRGWSADLAFRVQLAYEEAIVNAIRHGNRFADDKTVDVSMLCDHDFLVIEITDMGAGFNPDEVPDPRAEDRLEIPGGRGVMLIHELMSSVQYNEKGNSVRMRKDRSDSGPHAPRRSED